MAASRGSASGLACLLAAGLARRARFGQPVRMLSLLLAAVFFVALHLGVSGTRLRGWLVARLGLRGYLAGFSVLSVLGISWLVASYARAGHVATWGLPAGWGAAATVLMLPAFLLVVAGLATPNPTAVAQEALAAQAPQGIVRVTRHPFLVGVALWAAVHLVGNGDLASLVFFGSLLAVSALGPASIDARRRRALGAGWDGFARRSSVVPFAAILAGRTAFSAREIGWWRPAAALGAYALLLGGHRWLVGVSPFP